MQVLFLSRCSTYAYLLGVLAQMVESDRLSLFISAVSSLAMLYSERKIKKRRNSPRTLTERRARLPRSSTVARHAATCL